MGRAGATRKQTFTLGRGTAQHALVAGKTGSGKSTLINDTLHHAVAQHIYGSNAEPAAHDAIKGLENFDKVISVDQSPIGRTPRSNPATYTGLFTPIRELFCGVPAARERGYEAGRFSLGARALTAVPVRIASAAC